MDANNIVLVSRRTEHSSTGHCHFYGTTLKTLIILLALILIVAIIRHLFRQQSRPSPSKPTAKNMVKCKFCGLFLPLEEAVQGEGHNYCSEEHRDAGTNK